MVDRHHAGLDRCRERRLRRTRVGVGREAERQPICLGDHIDHKTERRDDGQRTERLLVHHPRFGRDVGQYRGFEEVALVADTLPPVANGGTLLRHRR